MEIRNKLLGLAVALSAASAFAQENAHVGTPLEEEESAPATPRRTGERVSLEDLKPEKFTIGPYRNRSENGYLPHKAIKTIVCRGYRTMTEQRQDASGKDTWNHKVLGDGTPIPVEIRVTIDTRKHRLFRDYKSWAGVKVRHYEGSIEERIYDPKTGIPKVNKQERIVFRGGTSRGFGGFGTEEAVLESLNFQPADVFFVAGMSNIGTIEGDQFRMARDFCRGRNKKDPNCGEFRGGGYYLHNFDQYEISAIGPYTPGSPAVCFDPNIPKDRR